MTLGSFKWEQKGLWYFLCMRLHDQTKPITGLALTAAVRGNATI